MAFPADRESVPTRIYSYGAKPPHVGGDLVNDQMRLAHRYRNALVEVEHRRRAEVEAALRELSPDLVETDAALEAADRELEELRGKTARANAEARKRRATDEERAAIKAARERRSELYARRKELRAALFGSPEWEARKAEINARAVAEGKRLRAECGLYWGTYLAVEQSMRGARSGAPPRFHRFNGDGKIAVQIQGGLSVDAALACTDQRVRIEHDHARSTARRERVIVHLRVGSSGPNGREPVWASVRATLHRPIPRGASIKWVYLIRRRVACSHDWAVQFVLSSADGFDATPRIRSGAVALDLRWRLLPAGLRVAYWVDDRGAKGEVVLPEADLARWPRSDSLRATRDDNFNAARGALVEWLREHRDALPDWLAERTQTLAQWRSPARLAALAIAWREARFDGDEAAFEPLEAWRKQDRHLYEWERHGLRKAVRWRDGLYRNLAARLRGYARVVVEDTNWKDVQRRAEPEDLDDQAGARQWMRAASVGRLRALVEEACEGHVVRVDAAWTTRTCHTCEQVCTFDGAAKLHHACEHCGALWDQCENAARNLLRAGGGERPSGDDGPEDARTSDVA